MDLSGLSVLLLLQLQCPLSHLSLPLLRLLHLLLLLPLLRWLPWLRLLHWTQSHLSGLSDLLDLSLRWLLPLLDRQSVA